MNNLPKHLPIYWNGLPFPPLAWGKGLGLGGLYTSSWPDHHIAFVDAALDLHTICRLQAKRHVGSLFAVWRLYLHERPVLKRADRRWRQPQHILRDLRRH